MSEQTTAHPGISYHWIITIRFPDGVHATASGTATVTPPSTRAVVYQWVTQNMYKQVGTDNVAVVFFDAQPNDILGGAR